MSIEKVVKRAVMEAWEAEREVPFPLYEREAEAIAAAAIRAIRAYEGERARQARTPAPKSQVARLRDDHARREILRLARSDLDLDEMLLAARVEAHRRKGLTAGVLLEAKIVDALEKVLG